MNDPNRHRVLVVEDERHIAAGLKLNFEMEGYDVIVAGSAREAAEQLMDAAGRFDIILLDVMLPDADGFHVCRQLRGAGDFTPVLMLTAMDSTEDRVRAWRAAVPRQQQLGYGSSGSSASASAGLHLV